MEEKNRKDIAENLKKAKEHVVEANKSYYEGEYEEATSKYHAAIQFLSGFEATSDTIGMGAKMVLNQRDEMVCHCYEYLSACNIYKKPCDQFTCIRLATVALNMKPALELALYARAKAFTMDGVWQSRKHFQGDMVALYTYFPESKYINELLSLPLPDPVSTETFGDINRMNFDLSNIEVQDAYENQKKMFQYMIKAFSNNLSLADKFDGMYGGLYCFYPNSKYIQYTYIYIYIFRYIFPQLLILYQDNIAIKQNINSTVFLQDEQLKNPL